MVTMSVVKECLILIRWFSLEETLSIVEMEPIEALMHIGTAGTMPSLTLLWLLILCKFNENTVSKVKVLFSLWLFLWT